MKIVSLRLDDDQIEYFDRKNLNRSAAIRDAIDFYMGKDELKGKLISLMKIVRTSSMDDRDREVMEMNVEEILNSFF